MQVERRVGKHAQAGLRVPTCPLTCTHHVYNAWVPSALLRVLQPPRSLAAVLMSVYKFPKWGWGSPCCSGLCMYILLSLFSFPLCSAHPLNPRPHLPGVRDAVGVLSISPWPVAFLGNSAPTTSTLSGCLRVISSGAISAGVGLAGDPCVGC